MPRLENIKRSGKENKFEITSKSKINSSITDELIFSQMKEAVLGADYELSLVIIGKKEIKNLNKSYRGIDNFTDILSFPLSANEGEIFICLEVARKEAPNFNRSYDNFIKFLFIHGLVHLKGFKHSDKMEVEEKITRSKFKV